MATVELQIADWMKTPEFKKRLDAASQARDQAESECFSVLRELYDNEMLTKQFLLAGIKRDPYFKTSSGQKEADETAEHFADEVERVLKVRRDAAQEMGDCLRNIPKRTS